MRSPQDKVLVCAPNWLGDSVIALSALQTFRRRHPQTRVTVLVRQRWIPLWRMHDVPEETVGYERGGFATWRVGWRLRGQFGRAFVLPNSFRAAWIAFLTRAPERIGLPGHRPPGLLTRTVHPPPGVHQVREFRTILGVEQPTEEPERPRLRVPSSAREEAASILRAHGSGPWVGLMPGAARGPSKRWPEQRFVETGRSLTRAEPWHLVILGTGDEADLCDRIAAAIGPRAMSLAGRTSLEQFAAVLAMCAAVVGNDSGGVHLASAVGTPVVVVFGLTDPGKTHPLGPGHRVVTAPGVCGCRDIARRSAKAEAVLRAIPAQAVVEAVLEAAACPRDEPREDRLS